MAVWSLAAACACHPCETAAHIMCHADRTDSMFASELKARAAKLEREQKEADARLKQKREVERQAKERQRQLQQQREEEAARRRAQLLAAEQRVSPCPLPPCIIFRQFQHARVVKSGCRNLPPPPWK
jgi:hypothetical protein